MLLPIIVLLTIYLSNSNSIKLYETKEVHSIRGPNYGDPLFLTPYIKNNSAEIGKKAAKVPPIKGKMLSYAGYFTVNEAYNSNLFFWFFPSEIKPEAPVVLWLQGGPGISSLYGVFNEIGPFYVKLERGLGKRKFYWSQLLNVIYIDSPVGTGFSFTENDLGYSQHDSDVATDLYSALVQFFKIFPELKNNDFFIAGESYAGKFAINLANIIDTYNLKRAPVNINLKGISIGNCFCDPENMLNYSDYFYQIGLIDGNTKEIFNRKQLEILSYIKDKNFAKAFQSYDEMLTGDLISYKTLFNNSTRFSIYTNYLYPDYYLNYGSFVNYIEKDLVRRSIHVGNKTFNSQQKVEKYLVGSLMQSIRPLFEELIEKYRILVYSGQLDILVPYPSTVNFIESVQWSGATAYKKTSRKFWLLGNELVGYTKNVKGFTEVFVRNAGHTVPSDQPEWALDLISRFTYNKMF